MGLSGGRQIASISLAMLTLPAFQARAAEPPSPEDLAAMSIEELASIDVYSATKSRIPLGQAPASLYVVTREDIARSGATTVPDMLRLAPNLDVAQAGPGRYVITARGLNGNDQAQNFTNKLQVLIDGRSVYSPLYSGVYWDMQNVLPADVDRIEIISGPGAALWGANAINGVVNIVSSPAGETQGLLASAVGGALERSGGIRYGGAINDAGAYRVYANAMDGDAMDNADGSSARDQWHRLQAGFRTDWATSSKDQLTFQGDIFDGRQHRLSDPGEKFSGANLLARWVRKVSDSQSFHVTGYYDRTRRDVIGSEAHFEVNSWNIDGQHRFAASDTHEIVWGAGARVHRYHILGIDGLEFEPPRNTLTQLNLFAQDSIRVGPRTTLILGAKLEHGTYAGTNFMPSIRVSHELGSWGMAWASAAKAVRSPTPFDRDVRERLNGFLFVTGSTDFRPEKLTAYEAGFRARPLENLSLSASGFYNDYHDLRSIETTPGTVFPLVWGNELRAETYGAESWADWSPLPWWRLSAGLSLLFQDRRFTAQSDRILTTSQLGNDPKLRVSLKSSMAFNQRLSLDMHLRHVGERPDPFLPDYTELNGQLAWRLNPRLRLSISGRNLLHDRHRELPSGDFIERQILVGLQWGR